LIHSNKFEAVPGNSGTAFLRADLLIASSQNLQCAVSPFEWIWSLSAGNLTVQSGWRGQVSAARKANYQLVKHRVDSFLKKDLHNGF